MLVEIFTSIFIQKLFIKNFFPLPEYAPFILVYRNTDKNGNYISDTGANNCDTVLLIGEGIDHILTGRSYPHKKYQAQQVAGTASCNYIAPGFYQDAWVKGYHRGYRALVQKRSFMIYRSSDMELGNEDDYNEYRIVADNFHGCAPYSAGCVTVEGDMREPSGDWLLADRWIYEYHSNNNAFSVCILQHEDLLDQYPVELKFGAQGEEVKTHQRNLRFLGYDQVKIDGDFGPTTFFCTQDYENRKNK